MARATTPATAESPCPTTPSAICSASPPSAKATGRRSAAWSTAARRASRSTEADIQPDLDKRRPGQSRFTTQRHEPDAVKILSGVFADERRRAGHHRHADRAADRECRPALEGLFRHQGQVPARPRRLHLRRQIRHPRLSRRRPRLGARDRGARRRRRHRAQGRARHDRARRAGADGPAQDRPRALGLGRGRQQSVLLPRRQAGRSSSSDYLDGVRKSGSSVGAVIEVVAEGVPAGLGRADLRQARRATSPRALMSINAVKGVEIGDGFAAAALSRRGQCRRDAHGQRRQAACSCPTMPAAFSAASRPASRSSRASPSSRPRRS